MGLAKSAQTNTMTKLEAPWNRARKSKSELQEQRLGKTEGGSKQINSGRSTWTSPRDNIVGRVYRFLVEARTTDRGSYSISHREFTDLTKQAVRADLLPMIQLDIKDQQLAIIRLRELDQLQNELIDALGRLRDLEERLATSEEN